MAVTGSPACAGDDGVVVPVRSEPEPQRPPILVGEDVGRHNALDKLIGACLRNGVDTARGFCLVTSRCSFEMVQKAIAARMPVLVALSAPTALAIRTADQAGLTLVALDRAGQPLAYGAASTIPHTT